jgi:antitoxin StbD
MNEIFQRVEADLAISITDLKRNPAAAFEQARIQPVAVLSHARVVGYIVSPTAYEGFLEMAEDLQDIEEIERRKDEPVHFVDINDL